MRTMCAAVVAAAGLTGAAFGQLGDALTNLSFELTWAEAGRPANARPADIFGFTNNNDAAVFATNGIAHSGERALGIGPVAAQSFHGLTTDTLDAMPPNFTFLFFDVPISWEAGDLVWSYWYMVPANESLGEPPTPNWPVDANPGGDFVWPEGFAPAAMKIDIKGAGNGNQNNAGFDGWHFGFE
ncbi:MAG TPA: hypothetical protein VEB22_12455, partial [Phycisphaerales bacterium]|nr:hypothetical protein [Phycisphaerales bacterium]